MTYYCLPETKPYKASDEDWSDRYNYILIAKEYPKPTPINGNKKVTVKQKKEYNKIISDRVEMFKKLNESKEYQMYNRGIDVTDIVNGFTWLWNKDNAFVYKIKPTSYRAIQKQYSSKPDRTIYAFEVEEKYENFDELVDALSKTYFFDKVLQKIFNEGHYTNGRDKAIGYFEKYTDNKMSLSTLLKEDNLTWYEYSSWIKDGNGNEYYDFAKYLLDNNLVTLYTDEDSHYDKIFNILIRLGWYDVALDYLNSFTDVANIYLDDIKKQQDTISILNQHNDNEFVKAIIEKLDINAGQITLKIMEYNEDRNDFYCKDKHFFKEINGIRKFLIKEYDVDFEEASGELNGLRINEDTIIELE